MTEKHPFTTIRPLWLASTSRHRRALLERLRFRFEIAVPEVDEIRLAGEQPAALAMRLAVAKARAVAERHPQALVIGSDQVCARGDRVLGKPGTIAANREMLAALSGASACFHTAVALVCIETGLCEQHLDETTCHFRDLSAEVIAHHVELEPALDCAGGFKSEGLGISLMKRIESSDPTALVGLPLIWVATRLQPFLRAAP